MTRTRSLPSDKGALRWQTTGSQQNKIVVGVDGSDSSKDALAWGIRQARLTGGPLQAVMTWEY